MDNIFIFLLKDASKLYTVNNIINLENLVVELTFSSEVQVVFDPPLPLFQLLSHLSVLPTCRPKQDHNMDDEHLSHLALLLTTTLGDS